jgi:HK97 family phage major capsid protein
MSRSSFRKEHKEMKPLTHDFQPTYLGASPREIANNWLSDMQAIVNRAARENRELTAAEKEEYDALQNNWNHIQKRVIADDERHRLFTRNTLATVAERLGGGSIASGEPYQLWMDGDGKPVYAMTKFGKFADLPKRTDAPEGLSFGNMVRAIATGDWRKYAPREYKALGENTNSGGGYLVPDEVSRLIIDRARAITRVVQAGAISVPMTSDRMTIAKVDTDPTMAVHTEGTEMSNSEPAFGSVGLTSHTIGCYVKLSRELAADAPNIQQLVESVLAKSLAATVDKWALQGTGSAQWAGLTINADIGSTSSVGAIAWEDISTAIEGVRAANFEPTAYICSPAIVKDLSVLAGGDGSTTSKAWLGPPSDVAELQRYHTTNCPNANLFVGQWDQLVFGIRQEAMVEATTVGGNSFTYHELWIKVTFRGDVAVTQSGAFHRLDGITT